MSNNGKRNLDKICAEYGMGLLNEFKNVNLTISYNFNELLNIIDDYKQSSDSNKFDVSRKEDYKNKIESEIKQQINNIANSSEKKDVEKYLINSWIFCPINDDLVGNAMSDKDKKIEKEKKRIESIIKKHSKFSFDFSASNFETEITKALGILVEDGPFAYMIWLKSQNKEPHRAMLIQTVRLLLELNIIQNTNNELKKNLSDNIEKLFLDNISNNLTTLFLVKTVVEKMLIYARYKAKAMQKEGE